VQGLLSYFLFSEPLNTQWWLGASFILVGTVILTHGDHQGAKDVAKVDGEKKKGD
jgi:drug/metabolite transporter (DMT)-like permease